MQTLDLEQMHQYGWAWVTWQGESTHTRYGDRRETQNMIVFDVPIAAKLITETLKWQRSILEGDQELVKRSVRHEPTWDVTHLYMEAMLGISLYSYPYVN
jgi:hypothetical protein